MYEFYSIMVNEKEARYKSVPVIWFHLYKTLKTG